MVACGSSEGGQGYCYVKNDLPQQRFDGTLTLQVVDLATGIATALPSSMNEGSSGNVKLSLGTGPGYMQWLKIPSWSSLDGETSVIRARITRSAEATSTNTASEVCDNTIALVPPAQMKLAKATVTAKVLPETAQLSDVSNSVDIEVLATAMAM